jgi:hypothetical protein
VRRALAHEAYHGILCHFLTTLLEHAGRRALKLFLPLSLDTPCKPDFFGHPMQAKCGATTRGGTPCKNDPMLNGKCRMHGGMSKGGVESPTYKDGRYSKFLPKNLGERYDQLRSSPEVANLHDEIALVVVRIQSALEGLSIAESGETWRSLKEHWVAYEEIVQNVEQARRGKFGNKTYEELLANRTACEEAIKSIIQEGYQDVAIWSEVQRLILLKCQLQNVETRRRAQLKVDVPVEQVLLLIGRLTNVVIQNVHDETAQKIIADEFDKFVGDFGPADS